MSIQYPSLTTAVPGRTSSWLFTPATHPDRFEKASSVGADVLIVDLEDSVPPSEKSAARKNMRDFLAHAASIASTPLLAVRINSTFSRFGIDDLIAIAESTRKPDFILLPKIEAAEQIVAVHAFLAERGEVPALVPMIESVTGLLKAESIAQAKASVVALMFGAADFASDARVQPDSLVLQIARCQVAMACAMASIKTIDAPCFAIHDVELLQTDLIFALKNGFQGKAAIHPSHIETINTFFTPSPQRIEWAKRVIEAAERGAGVVDGRMVDEAIAREARDILSAV
jgi:(S)-citramalyl-CoA lyase